MIDCPQWRDGVCLSGFYGGRPSAGTCAKVCELGKKSNGSHWKLGNIVSSVVTPIAAMMGHPCVDKWTRKLKPGSACDKRRLAMNGELTSAQKADK